MPQTEHSTVYTSQLELELGINFAPAIVREHGLRDAHLQPLVAWRKGQSFRVHASKAWGYPSLELRAGNSWPAVTLDCDLPTVVDALHAVKSQFPLPVPNMEPDQIADSGLRAIYGPFRGAGRAKGSAPSRVRLETSSHRIVCTRIVYQADN